MNIINHVKLWNSVLEGNTEYLAVNASDVVIDNLLHYGYAVVIKTDGGYIINRLACSELVNNYVLNMSEYDDMNLYEYMVNNRVTIFPFSDNLYDNFSFYQGSDSMNNDIGRYTNKTIEELKEICKSIPECVGFNSNGWMKSKIVNPRHLVKESSFVGPTEGIYIDLTKKKELVYDNYIFYEELDSPGSDLVYVKDKSIEELKVLCDNDPNCMGFNTLGWLKSSVNVHNLCNLYGNTTNGYKDGIYVKDMSGKIAEAKSRIINRVVTNSNLTFTITTCKRLDKFIDTMTHLLLKVSDLNIIDEWILIDDNSSESDREYMKTEYPFFTFIMKNVKDKGHAKSMNMLWDAIKTDYVFHFEDDWRCNKNFNISNYLDYLKENNHKFNHLALRNISRCDHIACDEIDNNTVYKYVYNKSHTLKPSINKIYDEICSNNIGGDCDSDSDMYWWWCNGFTLNCSIFNVSVLKNKIGYFKENVKQELFEYDYALRTNNAGLKMAYVDLNIDHTGYDISSYSLNDMKRSYDK